MAKQDLSRHQQGIVKRYYENFDTIKLEKLGQIVSDLYLTTDQKQREKLWKGVERALQNSPVPESRVQRIVEDQDVQALARLLTELDRSKFASSRPAAPTVASPAPAPASTPSVAAPVSPAPTASAGQITSDTLKMAMNAFKKRLKLTRLDEESKLGRSPLTGSGKMQMLAIQPPNQFPRAVWDELVKQGKLKNAGGGLLTLP